MKPHLGFANVGYAYGTTTILDSISLKLEGGEYAALIGPNGAGKSTLLHLASGTLRPRSGRIDVDGRELGEMPAAQRARQIALVPQTLTLPFAFTVHELVALGRTPYLSPLRGEGEQDQRVIAEALRLTETAHLAGRSALDLSGGERQRVLLAMALAQEPALLLLDEPTANLDIGHQVAMLELLRQVNRTRGLTVLAAIHDLNLAALYFDRLLVLHESRLVADGPPAAVLTPGLIATVYGTSVQIVTHPQEPVPQVTLLRNEYPAPANAHNPAEKDEASWRRRTS
jgi:iron complex transport system ATP-binding protein